MIEKITLAVFWTSMVLCAGSVLALLWFETAAPPRIAPTFFVIGLASLLIWVPIITYRFLLKMNEA